MDHLKLTNDSNTYTYDSIFNRIETFSEIFQPENYSDILGHGLHFYCAIRNYFCCWGCWKLFSYIRILPKFENAKCKKPVYNEFGGG